MRERLTASEISHLNDIISKCEFLVNARGAHNGRLGLFEGPPFEIIIRRDATGSGVQVKHRGEIVLQVRWDVPPGPGHAVFEPGAWCAALLRLPAAHA